MNTPDYLKPFLSTWEENREHSTMDSVESAKQNGYNSQKVWSIKNQKLHRELIQAWRIKHPNYARNHSKEYRKNNPKYWDTDAYRKKNAHRQRNMEWIKLFESIFSDDTEIAYHHISDAFVIPIPKRIHLNNLGKNHREKLQPIIENLYQISYIIVDGKHGE